MLTDDFDVPLGVVELDVVGHAGQIGSNNVAPDVQTGMTLAVVDHLIKAFVEMWRHLNDKITNNRFKYTFFLKQEAHQLVGLGKTQRHSTLTPWQTTNVSLLAILREIVTELCASMPAAIILRTFAYA